MDHDTLTLLMALVAIIAGFGTALGFVVRKLMDRNDKLIGAWQKAMDRQHAETRATVSLLAAAVKEMKDWQHRQATAFCSMDKFHDEYAQHLTSLAAALAELMALSQRTHQLVEQINGKV